MMRCTAVPSASTDALLHKMRFLSPEQRALARRAVCERCDRNGGLTALTVERSGCRCAGVSLATGSCRLNKWPVNGEHAEDQRDDRRVTKIAASDQTPLSHDQLHAVFDRVIVINLRHRPDRLTAFRHELEQKSWPFVDPEVSAATIDDALSQLPAEAQSAPPTRRPDCVVLLKCPRDVVEKLRAHGFHTGYWCDPATDIDNGLIRIFREHQNDADRIPALREWLRVLQEEADAIPGGVVAGWHPMASRILIAHATTREVLELTGNDLQATIDGWRPHRNPSIRHSRSFDSP